MGWIAKELGFDSWQGKDFSLLCSIHTEPLIQQILGALSQWVKGQGHEGDHSLPSSAEVRNGGTIPQLPICLHSIIHN
jgi:hypothetical protein